MYLSNKINKLGVIFLTSVVLAGAWSDPAFAQLAGLAGSAGANAAAGGGGGSGGGSGNTLGGVISSVVKSSDGVPGLFKGFSYLMGLFFGFWGVMKLKDHVDNPNNPTIWEPLKRFLAGGMFFALPAVMGAAVTSVAKDVDSVGYSSLNKDGASALGLDGMLVKLMEDVWEPMHLVIIAFCYLAGIFLIMFGISRLLKSEQDGPNGPAGIGTIMTFLVGGALLSVDRMLGATLGSMFDKTTSSSNGVLVYTKGLEEGLPHAHAVIASIIMFVAILGIISFVRGLFILRGVTSGNSQASMMAAVTHILGGAVAVNLGGFIMAVQNTLGITGQGVGITFN